VCEAEWEAATDPNPILEFIGAKISERKLRLFACACCRRIWQLMTDDRSWRAVEVAELLSDKTLDPRILKNAVEHANQAVRNTWDFAANSACLILSDPLMAAEYVSNLTASAVGLPARRGRDYICEVEEFASMTDDERYLAIWAPKAKLARIAELESQAALLRDIVYNLFCTVSIDYSWFTSTALALAQQMYESRDFSAMPILADALQDAGCDNEEILQHCRGENIHVRGCWVVDLLTGRT
jgi:hypothetical protein